MVIKKAFVLAAGKGLRMRPLTDNCPKPLLDVGGRTMLDRALDDLRDAGVEEVVVNTHYLGDMIKEHLKTRTDLKITVSHEDELLDTAGGVKKKIGFFGDEPFFVLNADVIWTNGEEGALKRLARAWKENRMDLLLLLCPKSKVNDPELKGDFSILSDGRLSSEGKDMVFAGPRIVHPRLFKDTPDGAFSFSDLFKKAENSGRLHGLVHDAKWYHVGTPAMYESTQKALSLSPQPSPPRGGEGGTRGSGRVRG